MGLNDEQFSELSKIQNETTILTNSVLKSVKIIQNQIIVPNEEILELITFFSEREQYILCKKLKQHIIKK